MPLAVRVVTLRRKLDAGKDALLLPVHVEHLRLSQSDIEWTVIPRCLHDKYATIPVEAAPNGGQPVKIVPASVRKGEAFPGKGQIASLDGLNQDHLIRASTVISKYYKMFRTRRLFRLRRRAELEFLGVLGTTPCIERAIERENRVDGTLNNEAEAFFGCETKRRLDAYHNLQERELHITFLDPARLAIWKYYEINGEFPPSITELLSCMEKGDLRKLTIEPPSGRQAAAKPTAQAAKKKVQPVKAAEQQPERDKSLDELVNAVKSFKFRTGMPDIDEQGITNRIKARMIRELLEPELAEAAGIKPSSTNHETEAALESDPNLNPVGDISVNLDGVFIQDMFQDHVTLEDTFNMKKGHDTSRTSVVVKLLEEIVLPLGSQYVFSRCGLPYRSLLLYGPPGCGKMTIVKLIATETKGLVVDFGCLLKLAKDDISKRIEGIRSIANAMTPVIVLVEGVEHVYPLPVSKVSSKKTANSSKTPNPRDVLKQMNEILKEGKVIIVGTCSESHCDIPVISSLFEKKIFVPTPNQNECLEAIIAIFQTSGRSIRELTTVQKESIVTAAKYTERKSMGSIIEATSSVVDQTYIFNRMNLERILGAMPSLVTKGDSEWVGFQ